MKPGSRSGAAALCKKSIEETSWIKPQKYIGIWWGTHTGKWTHHPGEKLGAKTDNVKEYMDFASRYGFEYTQKTQQVTSIVGGLTQKVGKFKLQSEGVKTE